MARKKMDHTSLGTTADVAVYLNMLDGAGCKVTRDKVAGTVVAHDGDIKVFAAIQKGTGNARWIMMFWNSDNIQWSKP